MIQLLCRSLACAGVLALVAVPFLAAQGEKKAEQPNRLPGPGVADPTGKFGFFPSAAGGIDALDLASGKLQWTTKEANRPLLASADRVFAHMDIAGKPNQFRIVILDSSKDGKRVLETEPIALPGWVSVVVDYGRTYQSSARLDGGDLYVAWEARAFYAGGARPTPEIEKAARMNASGVVRIDIATGKVTALEQDKIKEGKFFPLTGDVQSAKAGELTLSYKDGSAKNPKNPYQQKRMLQATNGTKVVWEHEIAAPIILLPRP
jgi:hypothetical protein